MFGNQVSAHLSVPNGMDPPLHTPFRQLVEGFFTTEQMDAFAPVCREIAAGLVRGFAPGDPAAPVDAVAGLGLPYAARVQCRFLGWPVEMEAALLEWADRNLRAIRDLDRPALAENARRFEDLGLGELRRRRETGAGGDLTALLLRRRIDGRPLTDAEMVSLLRNWTAGEIGTISASVGILVHFLAARPDVQAELRAQPGRIPAAIGELLRLRGPLLTNRRRTRCPVRVGDTLIPADAPVTLHWAAADRDPRAFPDPLVFRPDRAPDRSLLFGAGIHVCPGEPLARLELRLLLEELLAQIPSFAPDPGRPSRPAEFPLGGYADVWIRLHPAIRPPS
ncbi:MAG: cytochrome P450 [Kiritimatiellia bacterium]